MHCTARVTFLRSDGLLPEDYNAQTPIHAKKNRDSSVIGDHHRGAPQEAVTTV
jgi:hypothetical protein